MVNIRSFMEIVAWQKAHEFVLEVYSLTKKFPKEELYCLTNQIRRAVISIPSNIAEGFKRKSPKDSCHFYNISNGSLEETKYQLLLAKDLGYIKIDEFNRVFTQAEETGRLLNGWIKSQKAN